MSRLAIALVLIAGCGGSQTPAPPPPDGDRTEVEVVQQEITRENPPASGPARDIQFPEIARANTASGLELNTVRFGTLPVVYLRLVIRSGDASDPAELPGVAHFVAQMLKEGTRTRSSAELAEAVEFLGADLTIGSDQENVYVMISALSEHIDQAMEILADVALNPAFSETELRRLKRRELDRLELSAQQPRYLARRTFFAELYGNHPYAHIDTNPRAVNRMSRTELQRWHRAHFVPSNAFLVAAGDVDAERIRTAADRVFANWRNRTVAETEHPAPPARTTREVIVVDRPQSVQSVIYVGNLALARNDPSYVPLTVANQVLGGSAASRLFMDLRERRSLTYGAYSNVEETREVAPFIAYAAVRNEVTADAMAGFMEHLDRIAAEAPPANELQDAQRFLSDSFPLDIETAGRVAWMTEQLRVFNLPDDYWDTFRSAIRQVTAEQAHAAAREYIRPSQALIVAVGRAADIAEPLRRYGPVRIIDTDGREVSRLEAAPAAQ